MKKRCFFISLIVLAFVLSGCVTMKERRPYDPFEKVEVPSIPVVGEVDMIERYRYYVKNGRLGRQTIIFNSKGNEIGRYNTNDYFTTELVFTGDGKVIGPNGLPLEPYYFQRKYSFTGVIGYYMGDALVGIGISQGEGNFALRVRYGKEIEVYSKNVKYTYIYKSSGGKVKEIKILDSNRKEIGRYIFDWGGLTDSRGALIQGVNLVYGKDAKVKAITPFIREYVYTGWPKWDAIPSIVREYGYHIRKIDGEQKRLPYIISEYLAHKDAPRRGCWPKVKITYSKVPEGANKFFNEIQRNEESLKKHNLR